MKPKLLLYACFVALALLVASGQRVSSSGAAADRSSHSYAYQSDNGTHYGSATRTVALQSVSSAAYRTVSIDAKKSLHRFVSYFNHLAPTPDVMEGIEVSSRVVRWPMAQGVRLAFLRTIRI